MSTRNSGEDRVHVRFLNDFSLNIQRPVAIRVLCLLNSEILYFLNQNIRKLMIRFCNKMCLEYKLQWLWWSCPNASGVSRIFLHKKIKYVCCRESYIECWWSWSTGDKSISMSSWSHLDVICGGICMPNLCVKHDGRLLWSQPMNAPLHKRLDSIFQLVFSLLKASGSETATLFITVNSVLSPIQSK